ncbi:VanZ family protein [Novosphingobium terrae]|jgi:hypothetical protein|uniref:hypothetical protein n=1 Tax=Novosphingobium terrae TaxID=2726189 RepID=UPI00197FED50|nr:hypothetical protein [Novosphingobium terrae]
MTIDKPSRGVFLLLLATVLYLTLMPSPPHVALDNLPFGDKIEHFLAFGSLTFAARFGFPRMAEWLVLERLSFLGAMIEVVQGSPGLHRDCDWRDWAADTLGVLVALAAVRVLYALFRSRQPRPTLH